MKLLRYADAPARVVAATVPGAIVLLSAGVPSRDVYARLVAITRRRGRPTRAVVAWCGVLRTLELGGEIGIAGVMVEGER